MRFTTLSRFLCLAASLAVFSFAGCAASMRPISSKPPLAKITFPAPFDASGWHPGLMPAKYHVLLPAGEYRPLYEDDQSYYFQAPSKVVVNDPGTFLFDGGIYVPRGTTKPAGWYYVDQDGSPYTGAFNVPPPTR
jgi:hypothetical protein